MTLVSEPTDATGATGVLAEAGSKLADGIAGALPGWVERSVERVLVEARGVADPDVMRAARDAGAAAGREVGAAARELLARDVDAQRATPLQLLRDAARYPTEVLAAAGVPPVARDEADVRLHPDDVYGLAPATWGDVDAALVPLGIAWGAAKAFEHRRRHMGDAGPGA